MVVMSLGELCCFQMGTRPGGAVQGHRGNVVILHNLKDHPLKAKAERGAKRIGVVWGGGPVKDDRLLHGVAQELLDAVPLAIGCACFCLTICVFFLYGYWDLEFTTMINIEIIMPRVIGVKDKLLHFVSVRVKEDVHSKSEVVKKVVIALGWNLFVGGRRMDFHLIF